jgi:hypothetical protein
MAHLSLLAAPLTSNDDDDAHAHGPVGRTRSTGAISIRTVVDAPSPLSPLPGLTEITLRHLLGAIQALHSILAVAHSELRKARAGILGP